MEIRIQRWLGECQKFDNRSMVNDRIVDFDPLIKMVLNSSMNVTLPPNFIVKSATETPDTMTGLKKKSDEVDDRGRKKRKNNEGEGCIVKNPSPINDFLIKDSENWKKDFSGQCTKDRPKWDDKTFMCARWFIRGECFCDCFNKASHMGASDVPTAKHDEFKAFIGKVCRENTTASTLA
jgi:hypothetical protein